MRKILGEIVSLIIVYVICSVYAYFNTDLKGWSWLVSAILMLVIYGIMKLSEYLRKKKRNSKKDPPQSEK